MNIRNDNGKLTVELVGKVDTNNAHEVEAELNAATRDARDVTIDASGLDYISSAGLRVLLKLRKRLATLLSPRRPPTSSTSSR